MSKNRQKGESKESASLIRSKSSLVNENLSSEYRWEATHYQELACDKTLTANNSLNSLKTCLRKHTIRFYPFTFFYVGFPFPA